MINTITENRITGFILFIVFSIALFTFYTQLSQREEVLTQGQSLLLHTLHRLDSNLTNYLAHLQKEEKDKEKEEKEEKEKGKDKPCDSCQPKTRPDDKQLGQSLTHDMYTTRMEMYKRMQRKEIDGRQFNNFHWRCNTVTAHMEVGDKFLGDPEGVGLSYNERVMKIDYSKEVMLSVLTDGEDGFKWARHLHWYLVQHDLVKIWRVITFKPEVCTRLLKELEADDLQLPPRKDPNLPRPMPNCTVWPGDSNVPRLEIVLMEENIRLMKQGYSVLKMDLDVAMIRNPYAYFTNNYDIEIGSDTSRDYVDATADWVDTAEAGTRCSAHLAYEYPGWNTGIYRTRPTQVSIDVFQLFHDTCVESNMWEQAVLQYIAQLCPPGWHARTLEDYLFVIARTIDGKWFDIKQHIDKAVTYHVAGTGGGWANKFPHMNNAGLVKIPF